MARAKQYAHQADFYFRQWQSEQVEDAELVALRVPERTPEEKEQARATKSWHISKGITPELLTALKKLRSGELKANDKIWKTFDLHETHNALRHGGPTMHAVLARTMDDGFAQVCRGLEKSLKNYTGCLEVVKDDKRQEIKQLKEMQAHCRTVK